MAVGLYLSGVLMVRYEVYHLIKMSTQSLLPPTKFASTTEVYSVQGHDAVDDDQGVWGTFIIVDASLDHCWNLLLLVYSEASRTQDVVQNRGIVCTKPGTDGFEAFGEEVS